MSSRIHATRPWKALILAIGLTACENQTAPTPPEDPAPPPPPTAGSLTASGVVREYGENGENRPVPNLRLKVRRGVRDGAVGSTPLDDVVTDADGRYSITGVSGILFFQTDPGSDFRFLCDAYPMVVRAPGGPPIPFVNDLPVVHRSWSGNRPPQPWIIGTSVWGTVSERVDGALQPVGGATVDFESGLLDPPATTTASGFYMICSIVGTDQTRTITASKDGYNVLTREIFGGWDYVVHLELTRK